MRKKSGKGLFYAIVSYRDTNLQQKKGRKTKIVR